MSRRLHEETLQFLYRAVQAKERELQTTLGQFRREKVEAELRILNGRLQTERADSSHCSSRVY
ncbi:MAG TPA: hypothetical protein VF593_06055 [Chthoniobacteraceae bacterium]|jgi:hypothetical protein